MYYTFKINGKSVRLYHNDLVGDNGAMIEEFPDKFNKKTGELEMHTDKVYKLERDADGYLRFKYSNGEIIYIRDAECLTPEQYVDIAYNGDTKGIDLEYALCTVLQKYGLHSIAIRHRINKVEDVGKSRWVKMHVVAERNRMPLDDYKIKFRGTDETGKTWDREFYVGDFIGY